MLFSFLLAHQGWTAADPVRPRAASARRRRPHAGQAALGVFLLTAHADQAALGVFLLTAYAGQAALGVFLLTAHAG